MHTWIGRHPDDGRFILTNGYDWTYFQVDDAPYTVRSIRIDQGVPFLILSDETEEAWDPGASRIGGDGAIYARVKASARGGPYEAKFTRHAQTELAPLLVFEADSAQGAQGKKSASNGETIAVKIAGEVRRIG